MNLSRLNKNPVAWYSTGTILRQLTAFIMLPVYTQYLSPAEYGIIGFLAVILGIYELFLGARFGMALPKFFYDKDTSEERHRLVSSALVATAAASILGTLFFALSSGPLATHFFERPDLSLALAAYGITLLSSSVEEYTLVFLRLRDKPFFFFMMSIMKLALQVGLNLYFLIVQDLGVAGVIYGNVIASMIIATVSGVYTYGICGWHFDRAQVKALVLFTWPMWLSGIAAVYISFMTNFLLKHFASLEEVGLFHFGQKFATLIALLLWRPFNQWWQTERFKVAKHSDNPQKTFASAFILILSIMCIGAYGISIFSGSVIELMADPSYLAAATVIPIMCFSVMSAHLGLFFNFPFLKTSKTGYFPKLKFARAIILTILMWWFTSEWQLLGAVVAILTCQLLELLALYLFGQRLYDQGIPVKTSLLIVGSTVASIILTKYLVDASLSFWIRNGYFILATVVFFAVLVGILFGLTGQGKNLRKFVLKT